MKLYGHSFLLRSTLLATILVAACRSTEPSAHDAFRPLLHFTPDSGWMNDPNGMVYYNGTYHLFFQYYPDSTVWGPMHWGHATSTDLVSWQEQPIALYPDSLGYIFSGSAVIDSFNTSGFARDNKVPMIAIFTHHSTDSVKEKNHVHQVQSIAYSLDEGKTWEKYAGNPVLPNPGIHDFRDPKVIWHADSKAWVMSLAAGDSIMFYSSSDLKKWIYLSSFGAGQGAHGGVWECPDLFPMEHEGNTVWVLLVNINPGAPNGGSGTQYFIGRFNGKTFSPYHNDTRWMDYGPDNYAGVTWSNTGNRRLLIGWMSNWLYGQQVPTGRWRSGMTIARELAVEKQNDTYWLVNKPVVEIEKYVNVNKIESGSLGNNPLIIRDIAPASRLSFTFDYSKDWEVKYYSESDTLLIAYSAAQSRFFIDRSKTRNTGFHSEFKRIAAAPVCFKKNETGSALLLLDNTSVEFFSGDGVAMTALFFPQNAFSGMTLENNKAVISYSYEPVLPVFSKNEP